MGQRKISESHTRDMIKHYIFYFITKLNIYHLSSFYETFVIKSKLDTYMYMLG